MYKLRTMIALPADDDAEAINITSELSKLRTGDDYGYMAMEDNAMPEGSITEGVSVTRDMRLAHGAHNNSR